MSFKQPVEKRSASGIKDYIALAITTFGVGYIPGAPGTYGSIVAVGIFLLIRGQLLATVVGDTTSQIRTFYLLYGALLIGLVGFALAGIWAAGRSIHLLGDNDPREAVVDEVIGQLVVFLFVPVAAGWPLITVGFVLFRLFDIWKPYPINLLQDLPGGLGIVSDDILAGVYAGVCLSIIYAVTISL